MTRPAPVVLVPADETGDRVGRRVEVLAGRPGSPVGRFRVLDQSACGDPASLLATCEQVLAGKHGVRDVQVVLAGEALHKDVREWVDEAIGAVREGLPGANVLVWGVLVLEGPAEEAWACVPEWVDDGLDHLAGMLLVSRHTETSPALPEEEGVGQAADLVYALGISGLGSWLLGGGSRYLWAAGVSSLIYMPEETLKSLAARQAGAGLRQTLLEPGDDNDERHGRAFAYSDELGLVDGALERELIRTPHGDLRDEVVVREVRFRDVPLGFWPDRLASYHDFLRTTQLPKLLDQVSRKKVEIKDGIRRTLDGRIERLMRDDLRIRSAERFLIGFSKALPDIRYETESRAKRSRAGLETTTAHNSLVERIRHLPFAQALTARWALLGFVLWGVLVIVLMWFEEAELIGSSPSSGVLAVIVAGAGGIAVVTRLAWAWRVLYRNRHRYSDAVSTGLRGKLDERVHEEAVEIVQELETEVGERDPVPSGMIAKVHEHVRRCEEALASLRERGRARAPDGLADRELSSVIGIPTTPSDDAGKRIREEESRELAGVVLEDLGALEPESIEERALSWGREMVRHSVADDLEDLAPRMDVATATGVLRRAACPSLGLGREKGQEARSLICPGGETGPVAERLREPSEHKPESDVRSLGGAHTIECSDRLFCGFVVVAPVKRFDQGQR